MSIDRTKQSKFRPENFEDFIWQEHITNILKTAISSAKSSRTPLGHVLFSWNSGFWKTTLATIAADMMNSRIKAITWYAISRPSELISLLHLLQDGDILFIDEIHRLKPTVEEVLYTAMEDFCVDMLMPDGHHVRLPVNPFTLIWATTKLESLSAPLKNRFVYHFFMEKYSAWEKMLIIERYLNIYKISHTQEILEIISDHIAWVPRQIANFCFQLKDYLTVHTSWVLEINMTNRWAFWKWTSMEKWWITPMHQHYIQCLEDANSAPVGLKTISSKLWISEKTIENDIEPLLFELDKIEKTWRWRILK